MRNPDEPREDAECLYAALQAERTGAGLSYPMPSAEFGAYAAKFVQACVVRRHDTPGARVRASAPATDPRPAQDHDKYTKYIGFDAESLERAAWVRLPVVSTMPRSGTDAIALLSDPTLLLQYKAAWDAWFAKTMPELVGGFGGKNADIAEVLRLGQHSCPKWNMLAVELAFFDGVLRTVRPPPVHGRCPPNPRPRVRRDALSRAHPRRATQVVATPLFSMLAIALFSRSLVISYLALYTLVAMLVALLGQSTPRSPILLSRPCFPTDRARAACPPHLVCSTQAQCTFLASPSALSRRSRSPSSSA